MNLSNNMCLQILDEIAKEDLWGHETLFEVGVEKHKGFYYAFLADCTISDDALEALRDMRQLPKEETYNIVGYSQFSLNDALNSLVAQFMARSRGIRLTEEQELCYNACLSYKTRNECRVCGENVGELRREMKQLQQYVPLFAKRPSKKDEPKKKSSRKK